MAIKFNPPSFIQENDPEIIQQRMMSMLPADIDNMPGGFPWDFTMPTAMEKAQLIQFHLFQTLMLMYPMWAWDEWLDNHASIAGLKRKEARSASGILTISGLPGTIIPSNAIFLTPASDDSSSIEFYNEDEYVIGESGVLEINIIAKEAGKRSNTLANTITLLLKPIKGITKIVNVSNMSGGTEQEDDESLRTRIQEVNESTSTSFVGNDSDYIRWAKEIVGVGTAIVVHEWDGPGTVKLVLIDANGEPANEQILQEVYDHIISPDNSIARLAPIGATLTVVGPTMVTLNYKCKINLRSDVAMEDIIAVFKEQLGKYYELARVEEVVKYNRVAAIITEIENIYDFSELKINGGNANIVLEHDEYPVTGTITFIE